MEEMSYDENAEETEVDQPLDELNDSEGQVEDTGDAASEPEWRTSSTLTNTPTGLFV